MEKFYWTYKTNESKNKTIGFILKKYKKINSLNRLQKFIADCHNAIVPNIVEIISKRNRINALEEFMIYEFK